MNNQKYNPQEWTPCPTNCAYCNDPDYGHPRPHLTQKRIADGKTVGEVEADQSRLIKLITETAKID
ncbi:MAG: hypothetical protein AABW51_00440 [Nanoarchaeota archaeon]